MKGFRSTDNEVQRKWLKRENDGKDWSYIRYTRVTASWLYYIII